MSMLAHTTHVLPLTTVQRTRLLPAPGKLLARQGQKVTPQDVIAQTSLSSEHILLDVARGLHVPPKQVEKYLERLAGENVSAGDLIANGPKGWVRRSVRSPVDGRILSIRNGQVLLEKESPPVDLLAGYAGTVTELIPDRGAVIEMTGALVQGAWGNGKVEFGPLRTVVQAGSQELTADRMSVELRGSVLVCGPLTQPEVLRLAIEIGVRGLVVSSLSVDLLSVAEKAAMPILLTEGFGNLPMNPLIFRLLSTNENREASINAEPYDRYTGSRPEVVIPLPSTGKASPPPLPQAYAPQQQVRLLGAPYHGQMGVILQLIPGLTSLPSGLRVQAADVRLESGSRVQVPLANLDVLGYK